MNANGVILNLWLDTSGENYGKALATGSAVASANVLLCIDAVNVRFDDINEVMGDILQDCIFDAGIDPQTAINETEAAINEILAQEKAK